ncbi:MAG: UDP-N-acetylglucosamine 1-carboxyvinyltransferase [Planctomycetota bacterium]
MDAFRINGGRPLTGSVRTNGSKNAALPLMAAALVSDDTVDLVGVPNLADTRSMARLLGELGVSVDRGGHRWTFTADHDAGETHARYDIVRTMRASICVLGPLLARRGEARVSMPGGCAIGDRPVDLHIRGLRALGAEIELNNGDIVARAPRDGLRGTTVFLGGPFGSTVLGTANVLTAACLARGVTVIESAACEPEIVDLADLLAAMGARISGAGSPRITVAGVERLDGATHEVMPDRIEAGTLVAASAITGGGVTIERCPLDALMAFSDRLQRAGVVLEVEGATEHTPLGPTPGAARVTVRRDGPLHPIEVTTQPHPGFPTDLQAQTMALLCLSEGNSVVTERIFPERFLHVAELSRMGASLFRQGPTVVVQGVPRLTGAPVMASDLRASAGLVLAGLAAEGTTTVKRVYHIDRGYESLETRLEALGASIERVDDEG